MHLLICTQKVDQNDPILGFFHRWIEEFAKHCDRVSVICLQEGTHTLPKNVRVYSLGKEKRRVSKLKYAWRFLRLIVRLRNEYDTVFVHMNPEYVVLGGWYWRFAGKKIGLWYVHKSVNLKLRIATFFANAVFTSSRESFRLPSRKVHIVGHGIDTEVFFCVQKQLSPAPRLITVGRITQSKGLETIIDALEQLYAQGIAFSFDVVGAPVRSDDLVYETALKKRIEALPFAASVHFLGAKRQNEVAQLLCGCDLFINASRGTGSLDKAVLESLACGIPAVSSNEAFRDLLAPYGLFAAAGTGEDIAATIEAFLRRTGGGREAIGAQLADTIRAHHSLGWLIPAILSILSGTTA